LRLYVIKRKDTAHYWANFVGDSRRAENGLAIHAFFRKKDAQNYLESTYAEHNDLFIVIPVETVTAGGDSRRTRPQGAK
jgi:hypothetical protein